MKIKNKKNKANYVNFKDGGSSKKIMIAAGNTADIPWIKNISQIINYGDFRRGFFEIINDSIVEINNDEMVEKSDEKKSSKDKKKVEDSLEKIEKEVKNYTNNKE